MKENTTITMKDIAKALNVSVATVSRALKDSPRISSEQRDKIKRYAREHDFFPNIIAESLRKNRVQPMKIIGVVIPELPGLPIAALPVLRRGSARGLYLQSSAIQARRSPYRDSHNSATCRQAYHCDR